MGHAITAGDVRAFRCFQDFSDAEAGAVARLLEPLRLARSETLFVQGDTGDAIYLLLTGRWALPNGPDAIPGAPTGPDGTVVAPNILRPMVPPELSSVAVLSMADTAVGGIRTSAAILRVLDRIAEMEAAAAPPPAGNGRPRQDQSL